MGIASGEVDVFWVVRSELEDCFAAYACGACGHLERKS